jgi:hypothetical protein
MSSAAMDLGKRALISKFQNALACLAERRQVELGKFERRAIETQGLSAAITNELEHACAQLRREIGVLSHQQQEAGENRGWVLQALNQYQQGFERGVREALDFNSLNA